VSIAARPKRSDELVALFAVLEHFESCFLLGRDDPHDVLF